VSVTLYVRRHFDEAGVRDAAVDDDRLAVSGDVRVVTPFRSRRVEWVGPYASGEARHDYVIERTGLSASRTFRTHGGHRSTTFESRSSKK
jgi:hypothetical protein